MRRVLITERGMVEGAARAHPISPGTPANVAEVRERIPWASPVLRWAGSKRKLLPHLLARCPRSFTRYLEPFAGSACLFFALRPHSAVLGDTNAQLIKTYMTLRAHPFRIASRLAEIPRTKRAYYRIRATGFAQMDDVSAATSFIYLNRYCFNGVYRINRSGAFNVPRGSNTGAAPNRQHLVRASVALRDAKLIAADFAEVLRDVKRGDFVYLDPPYAEDGRPRYGEYGYECFGANDVGRLVEQLKELDRRGARFLLSYRYSPKLTHHFSRWKVERILVRRHVAGFVHDRRAVYEVLVSNEGVAGR